MAWESVLVNGDFLLTENYTDTWETTVVNYYLAGSSDLAKNILDDIPYDSDFNEIYNNGNGLVLYAYKVSLDSSRDTVHLTLTLNGTNIIDNESFNVLISDYKEFIMLGINEDTTQGVFIRGHVYTSGGQLDQTTTVERIASGDLYTSISGAIPPDYTWESVLGVYGKSGHIVFSHVLDDSILTGYDISDINGDDLWLVGPTCLERLLDNCPIGEEVTAFYSGDFNHLTITKGTLSAYADIKIYAEGHVVEVTLTRPGTTRGWGSGFIGFIIDEENQAAKLVYLKEQGNLLLQPTGIYDMVVPSQTMTEMGTVWTFLHGHTDDESENEDINNEDLGTDPEYQSDIPIAGITKPAYGAYDTGFTTQYRMSTAELKALAQTFWSNTFWDDIKKFFSDPREIVTGLTLMPVIPETGTSQEIKAGGISTGCFGLPLTDQYVFDTYGHAYVKAEKGNFLDYDPYTKVTAHLPFVGEHSLSVSDVIGRELQLKYIFDFLTGSCVAEIDVKKGGKWYPRYFFGGSCGMQIPISSEDFSRTFSSALSAGATLGSTLSTIATGGLTAPFAISAASNMLANGINASPTVQFSSGSGSTNGMIGCKSAFLVIERPHEKVANGQQGYIGRPSFMKKKLFDCSGYTKCLKLHLDNIACTDAERVEIETLLTNGVRIETGSTTPAYTPSADTINSAIIFLKCLSDNDVIGKTWSTAEGDSVTIESKIMFDSNFINPKFLVEGNFTDYNYCYIPQFKRFYYITDMTAKTGNMMEIQLKCDVLQSWKGDNSNGILSNDAVLERQESLTNVYFSDNMYWTQADKEIKTVPFLTSENADLVFEIPEDNFILTIAGGE